MTINTRQDLDSISGTPAHTAFLCALKGACYSTIDTQVYPDGYDRQKTPADDGYIAPLLSEVIDDTIAKRFGYTLEELSA